MNVLSSRANAFSFSVPEQHKNLLKAIAVIFSQWLKLPQ